MEATMNEYQAEFNAENDAENKLAAQEETPAEAWQAITAIAADLKIQCAELERLLKDFNKSAL